jgi:hypothetical protein
MTLREKFSEEPININLYNFKLTVDSAKNLEKIADQFAIGFAEWICEKAEVPYIKGTMNGTLEIYKKEKEL